jgi:hypothetical protein
MTLESKADRNAAWSQINSLLGAELVAKITGIAFSDPRIGSDRLPGDRCEALAIEARLRGKEPLALMLSAMGVSAP